MTETNVDHILVYQDQQDLWRWSAVARNGEIVAEGESHTRPEDATRAARSVLGADVRVVEAEARHA
jgi:uncharacterized protein YegP (UPF0339 family)